MTALAKTDVVVTVLDRRKYDRGSVNRCKLVFGDASLTYTAGGVPIDKGNMGLPTIIESMVIVDQSLGTYDFVYDQSAEKIILRNRGHSHDLHLNDADQTDGATTRVNATTNKIGTNTGADVLVAGVDDVSAEGGIVKNAMGEPSSVAIAEQTIEVEVRGW